MEIIPVKTITLPLSRGQVSSLKCNSVIEKHLPSAPKTCSSAGCKLLHSSTPVAGNYDFHVVLSIDSEFFPSLLHTYLASFFTTRARVNGRGGAGDLRSRQLDTGPYPAPGI